MLSPEPQGFRPPIPSWDSSLQSMLTSDLAFTFVVTPPLTPSGGFTFRPARASGYCGADESVRPSPDNQLSWGSLPSDCSSAPFVAPQGGLIASPHAGSCAMQVRDPCPSVTTQQQSPGLPPGASAIRSTVVDLVRSSVLVFQRAAPRKATGGLSQCPGQTNPRNHFSSSTC